MRARDTIRHLLGRNQLNVLLSHTYSKGGKIDLYHPNLTVRYCPSTILDRLGYRSVLFNPFYFKESHDLMRTTNCDLIQCELLWSAPSGISTKRKFKKPLIFVNHNVEYLKFIQEGKFAYSNLVYLVEKVCCQQADKIVVVSEVDKRKLSWLYKIPEDKIHTIPNCVDVDQFTYNDDGRKLVRKKYGIENETFVLAFVGKLDYYPNEMAVKYIAEKICPGIVKRYPKTIFLIVGSNYEALLKYKNKNMIFTGYVKNLQDYYSASDIVLVPIDIGSGTRVKTLEAASCSRPIVTTKKGIEGQDFENNEEAIIANKVDRSFVEKILELIEDDHLRYTLGVNARRKVETRYQWKEQIEKFSDVYEEVL